MIFLKILKNFNLKNFLKKFIIYYIPKFPKFIPIYTIVSVTNINIWLIYLIII